jgi:hypothetical protein
VKSCSISDFEDCSFPVQSRVVTVRIAKAVSVAVGVYIAFIGNSNISEAGIPPRITRDYPVLLFSF